MTKRARGLTLTEILLALIVMVLGLLGILALFPAGLKHGKESMEWTQTALMAESVAEAITMASRMPSVDKPGTPEAHYQLTITHDSVNSRNGDLVYYQFLLPNFSDGMASMPTNTASTPWFHHPAASSPSVGEPSSNDPEKESDWRLVGDPWTKDQFEAIKGTDNRSGTDGSEPLDQFCYSFDVRKVNMLEYLMKPVPEGKGMTLAQLDPVVRMWEIRISVFRKDPSVSNVPAGVTGKRLIDKGILTTRITIR